jgi:transcriptional regulator with XRE-family HTH domain
MSERKVLGKAIKAIRKAQGIAQDTVANAAVMSPSHFHRIETGERQPSEAHLLAICKCLGIHPDDVSYEPETLILVTDPAHARIVRNPHSRIKVAA